MRTAPLLTIATLLLNLATAADGDQPMRLPSDPALSPDGKQLAFSWSGDVWIVPAQGGVARRMTSADSRESQPCFSPDGKTLALISDRTGSDQVYRLPVQGGSPEQITFHTEGCNLEQWTVDGESLLIRADRDHFWRHAERFFLIAPQPRPLERLLFDAYGGEGRLSPEGDRLLFVREGVRWWRKGYRGSQAGQIWMVSLKDKSFRQICGDPAGARSPLWDPAGKQFYYVGGQSGSMNLWQHNLETGKELQRTHFEDDSVVMPCIAANGKVIVFRQGFDFYRFEPHRKQKPRRLKIVYAGDEIRPPVERRTLDEASEVAFSSDGLEVAFIAGGDLWVMDTVLREPRQVTNTPEEERDPAFAPESDAILFVSDKGGKADIWSATREDADRYWWQNETFTLKRLTDDAQQESNLQWSPAGKHVAFVKGNGDLWVMDPDGANAKRLFASWNAPDYDWSPDGKWLVYTLQDNEFNRDIYLLPLDGSRKPFNLSRHPDNDYGPAWSPDGKMIAFVGRRLGTESDIYFVYLQKTEDEIDARDRKLKEAIEKIQKARKKKSDAGGSPSAEKKVEETPAKKPDDDADAKEEDSDKDERKEESGDEQPTVVIDFEDVHLRIRRVSIEDAAEDGLFWSHDSKKLAFTATINGNRGTYTISPPSELSPKLLSTTTGSQAKWISQGNQIVWLAGNKPASLTADGKSSSYSFSARQEVDLARKYEATFDLCWREMRDNYYDANLNHRNWEAIRRKYAPQARDAVDTSTLSTVINMMLGELNGSHLGFMPSHRRREDDAAWREVTAHLGVRFDSRFQGPGLKVRDVIRGGPTSEEQSKLEPDEVILRVDGVDVDPAMELTEILNGLPERDIHLRVRGADNEERDVVLRPTTYSAIRSLLYEEWIRDNQETVKRLSKDRFGYAHIRGMNMSSFYRFERELYAVAAGKEGLVIDVRENGGGSTTDHLLTVLTQPVHAITVPRGGQPGYPQDRKVYASWTQPIVVLCNQNSFSNAEIFSHAIKTLKRGKVVGVPTSGSVISTGGTRIMDMGYLRKPFRGWFLLKDGQDMELNGAVPHHVLWPRPGDIPAGKDQQLNKAIRVLNADVKAWKERPQPKLIKASERRVKGD